MRILTAGLAILLSAATAAAATTRKVPQQYETIQEAVNDAAEGDTILVSKGIYYESVYVNTPNLKIIGKKAVIDGQFGEATAQSVRARTLVDEVMRQLRPETATP